MKLVFFSNFFNHHQKYVSDVLYRNCDSYYFVETEDIPDERKRMGYTHLQAPYLIHLRDVDDGILSRCDAIVIGSASYNLTKREKSEKLIFYYSERPFKKKNSAIKQFYWSLYWRKRDFGMKRLYMLCSSAYTAADYTRFGLYRNKLYKWGYFPETIHYDLSALFAEKNPTEILWCGRFLDWKHPDDALAVAKRLKDDGISFRLTLIGTGEMEETLHRRAEEYQLQAVVRFAGAMPPEQVRKQMETAGIFLFTSDRQEGWGAVLNEAMNSGCAVVASHAAGSTPYLVRHKTNGFVYESGNVAGLYHKVRYLLDNPAEQVRVGKEAYRTIAEEWNAAIAATRLVTLAKAIQTGENSPDLYVSGPCSKAEIIEDDWFKEENNE